MTVGSKVQPWYDPIPKCGLFATILSAGLLMRAPAALNSAKPIRQKVKHGG